MKRLFTFVITMLLGASLAFAVPQDTAGSTDKAPKAEGKKAHKGGKKGHKGGKKGKKGGEDTTTAPPK